MGLTGRGVHINVPLSNVVIAYRPEGFIADQIAPIVPVNKQSDSYYIFNSADAFRKENTRRAPGTEANKVTRELSSGTFYCYNYALKDNVPYEDIANADANGIMFARQSRAEYIKDKLMLDMEYRVAMLCTSGSNVGSYATVASAWTDWSTGHSDPLGNIQTAVSAVQDRTGYKPNSIIFGNTAWRNFRNHDDVLSKIFGTGTYGNSARVANQKMVGDMLEMDRVLVGGAYYSTTQEGQSASLSSIWSKKVLVYYAPMTPRIDKPSLLYSFRWNAIKGMDMQAEVFDVPIAKAEQVQVGYYQDEKVTGKGLGFVLTTE